MPERSIRPAEDSASREIVVSREFDAPRELVFEAWSRQEHVERWWGPTGFTTTFESFAFAPGGVWKFVMHGPDGRDYPNRIVIEEIVRPERLVYAHGGGDQPVDFHVTVTFVALRGKTRVTLRSLFPSAAERERVIREYGALEGARQHLARLGEYVATLA